MDIKRITERLRAKAKSLLQEFDDQQDSDEPDTEEMAALEHDWRAMNKAADLIEQQAAELERLRESLAAWEKEAATLADERNRLRADAERYSQLRTWVEDRKKPSDESCIVISQDDFGAVVIEGKSIYAIGDSFSAAIDAARRE